MSHVTHTNESCNTYEWVMSHIRMSHVTRMNESCHTYEWVMSHVWMSHVTHTNESCHTYEWVMSYTWVSHDTHMSESCHIMSHMTHPFVACRAFCNTHAASEAPNPFVDESSVTYVCDMCVWHMWCHIWLIHVTSCHVMSHMTHPVTHDSSCHI